MDLDDDDRYVPTKERAKEMIRLCGHRFGRNHWCLHCHALYDDLRKKPDTPCSFTVYELVKQKPPTGGPPTF